MLTSHLQNPVQVLEAEMATRADYRTGLTIVVHAGVGRGFAVEFDEAPNGWHRAVIAIGDALRLSWDHDFTATRVWKLLCQDEALASRGFDVVNLNGFVNLYSYREANRFATVPSTFQMGGMMVLASDFALSLRTRLRRALDYHLIMGPERRNWIEVQRRSTDVFFEEVRNLPLYVAPLEAIGRGRLLACVETVRRPWWIEFSQEIQNPMGRDFAKRVWDAAQNWMLRLAGQLEEEFSGLPEGPVWLRLEFPEIETWNDETALAGIPSARPDVLVGEGSVRIVSANPVLRGYAQATNTAERWLIAGIALGIARMAGWERDAVWADGLAVTITGSPDARFLHAIPTSNAAERMQATVPLPKPRFVMDEDLGWSRLGLAFDAGAQQPGLVAATDVGRLLQTAVLRIWERLRTRLEFLDRRSVVTQALLNHESIDKNRAEWGHAAAALLTLHEDEADVVRAQNEIESRRALTGIASRALAEMAICTSPTEGAPLCTEIELDRMLSDVAVMLECAGQCDAYHYGLATGPIRISANGTLEFDLGFFDQLHMPYLYAQGERSFRDVAADYSEAFQISDTPAAPGEERKLDAQLATALRAEFGMSLERLVAITYDLTKTALLERTPYLSLPKSEILALFTDNGTISDIDEERAYRALTLRPRARWDESKPEGALARDWHPWRMNRKLSLTRRPLVQLDEGRDPQVIVFPAHADRTLRRIMQFAGGRLPAEMFDTQAVGQWIGRVVDEHGHAFNHQVAGALRGLGFEVEADVLMTRLGGDKSLGDIDVVAWLKDSEEVWAIECKRLLLDRTIGEIGERLADYTTRGTRNGKRTPIQKHLDRLSFLGSHRAALARFVNISENRLIMRSALITDALVPMQFTDKMTDFVDRVCDFRSLSSVFRP